jgi:AcrR family transcriptional regulator
MVAPMGQGRRPTAEQRLARLAEAATRVFGRLGYKRTHVADVAAEAGVSAGLVYSYVESKEALFHLVFAYGFGLLGEGLPPLPLQAPAFSDTLGVIAAGLRRRAGTPRLRAALETDDPADVRAELAGIVEERYAVNEALWPLIAVIERSAVDLADLEDFYFTRGRRAHIGQLGRYVQRRVASGHFRPQVDPAITARLVTEAIAWFAWHRHGDRDASLYDDDVTRAAVIAFVCDALVGPES